MSSKVYREWMSHQGRVTPSGFDTDSTYAIAITGPARRRRSMIEGIVVGIVCGLVGGLIFVAVGLP